MAGSIEKRGDNKWRLTVDKIDPMTGKRIRHRKNFEGTKTQAEKALQLFVAEVERGEFAANMNNITLAEYAEKWVEAHRKLAPKTYVSYKLYVEQRIVPAMGRIKLKDLKPLHIEKFYNDLLIAPRYDGKPGSIGDTTRHYIHKVLRAMLNDAVKWELIPRNPVNGVDPPKKEKRQAKYYDENQVKILLEKLDKVPLKWKALVYTSIFTGLRPGEVAALDWADIDLEKNVLTVRKSRQYVNKEFGTITKGTKNESSNRQISIPRILSDILKKHKTSQKEKKLKLGDKWLGSTKVFLNEFGAPLHPTSPNHWFKDFLKENNLPHITMHGLRHTHATILIHETKNVRAISGRLGHANMSTTMDIYSHMLKSSDQEASDTFDRLYGIQNMECPQSVPK